MRVVAKRREGFAHDVEIDDGDHRLLVDEPADVGGRDSGPSPSRLVAAGLASCVAITMEMYAERKSWDLGDVEVSVDVDYDGHVPHSFAISIHLPTELSEEQRKVLLKVAGKCPVHRLLSSETEVDVSYRVEDP